jgi:hypothetical protein
MFAIQQTSPSQVIFSSVLLFLPDFNGRKRIGTHESLFNRAIAALVAASPTIHAPDDRLGRVVFWSGGIHACIYPAKYLS